MEITPKIRKLIYGMFDTMIEGADKYVTKSSTWLIFTEEKRWVIEFTNTKTLWFNYNLFQSELKLLSMDCVDSKDIIKEWFESRFLEKDIEHVTDTSNVPYSIVEDTIQNGVKETIVGDGNVTCYSFDMDDNIIAEDVIQNGVKDILGWNFNMRQDNVEDTIENGVKEIDGDSSPLEDIVEDTIQNGVKYVKDVLESLNPDFEDTLKNGVKEVKSVYLRSCLGVGDAIQNGVKHTMWSNDDDDVKDVIKNGVKETIGTLRRTLLGVDDIIQNGVKDTGARHLRVNRKVDDAIENGVKEVKTPGNGDLVSTVEWMDENNTYNVPELIDEVIQNGVKEVKHKMAESYQQKDHMVTNSIITEAINYAIQNGVKS
jgi:hypothetical protein